MFRCRRPAGAEKGGRVGARSRGGSVSTRGGPTSPRCIPATAQSRCFDVLPVACVLRSRYSLLREIPDPPQHTPCTPHSSACPSRGINSTPAVNANQRRHPRLVARHDGQGKEEREEGAVELARLQRAPQARRPRQADHNARGHRPARPPLFSLAARDLQPRRSLQLRGAARTALRTPGCSPAAGSPTHRPLPRRRSQHSPRGWSGAARRSARCSCPSLSPPPPPPPVLTGHVSSLAPY